MNPITQLSEEKLNDVRNKLIAACDRMIAKGIKITPDEYGLDQSNADDDNRACAKPEYDCLCPMAAVAVDAEIEVSLDDPDADIAHHLGVDEGFVCRFISAFDGCVTRGDQAGRLGEELRAKYVSESDESDEDESDGEEIDADGY